MTISARALLRRPSAARRGPGRVRLAVCTATVAACVPYLTLKIAWLSGSTVGWDDADAARDSALYVGNAITMAMDAAAVLVALAFTFPWGRRVPAWLVLTPMWIAAGLLAPIALVVPLGSAVQTLLLTAFVLYARMRWADVFTVRTKDVPKGAPQPLQVLLARTAAVLTAVLDRKSVV